MPSSNSKQPQSFTKASLSEGEKSPFIVGLTGAIGSGKTTVAQAFKSLGIPVYDADQIGKELSAKGQVGYCAIVAHFGKNYLDQSGNLDRDKLGEVVFNQPAQRKQLEAILHPLILSQLRALTQSSTNHSTYVVWDIPLLVGSENEKEVDRILVVDAPLEKRMEWIKERNGWSQQLIEKVMSSQVSPELLRDKADDLIQNNESKAKLSLAIPNLHQQYLKLAAVP